jgi:hypothetical protein
VRERGRYVVKVVGPPEVEETTDGHASETPLPPELIDFYADNSVRDDDYGTLDNEVDRIVGIVRTILVARLPVS